MIIDCHTHIGGNDGQVIAPRKFIECMDSLKIDKSCVFTLKGLYSNSNYIKENDVLLEYVKGYPDRFVPFCTVNPLDGERALSELKRCVKLGMKGLKLHPWTQGFSPLGDYMDSLIEETISLNIPIIFHDGTPPNSTPLQIGYLAAKYPESKVILGHSGLLDMWKEALRAAEESNNIFLCSCGTSSIGLEKIVRRVGAGRVIFGSDFPFDGGIDRIKSELKKIELLPISENEKRKILRENYSILLG